MSSCPECKQSVAPAYRFCPWCGTGLNGHQNRLLEDLALMRKRLSEMDRTHAFHRYHRGGKS